MNIIKTIVFCLLLGIFDLLLDVRSVECIGQTGHMAVAEMAIMDIDETLYPDLVAMLKIFESERNCGSVFPDWAWVSFHSQYSDLAHTIEFQHAWADYVKKNFPPPYNVSERREISFLMGLTVHTYADPPWHTFFLPEAKAHDNTDHGLTEIGTDIFTNWELDKRSERTHGYFPVETAVNVYSSLGYTEVTESMLLKGMLELRAAYWVEKLVDYQGYLNLVHRMPWTHDNYIIYSPGGFAFNAEVSAPEMVNAWNYIQGNLDQLQLKDIPVSSEKNIFLELAQSLLESGAIEIPMQKNQQGECFFEEPKIVDWENFKYIVSVFGLYFLRPFR